MSLKRGLAKIHRDAYPGLVGLEGEDGRYHFSLFLTSTLYQPVPAHFCNYCIIQMELTFVQLFWVWNQKMPSWEVLVGAEATHVATRSVLRHSPAIGFLSLLLSYKQQRWGSRWGRRWSCTSQWQIPSRGILLSRTKEVQMWSKTRPKLPIWKNNNKRRVAWEPNLNTWTCWIRTLVCQGQKCLLSEWASGLCWTTPPNKQTNKLLTVKSEMPFLHTYKQEERGDEKPACPPP